MIPSRASRAVLATALATAIAFGMPLGAQTVTELERTSQDFIGVGKTAIPAVVTIQVKLKYSGRSPEGFFEYNPQQPQPDDFSDDFFGLFGIPRKGKSPSRMQLLQASGFLVSSDGYIVTNNHVVRDKGIMTVKLNDGREFPAKIIGADPATDIAVIKIDGKDLPFIKLGDSDALEVGQWVVAIGNPFGLQATLTVGVVSAKGRSNLDIVKIEDFIQTDAALNQGNSGGPLLNLKSDVVGMNTAIATTYGIESYMGIGFAIPSNMIKHVMQQLIEHGSVTRGQLGIVLQPIDQNLAKAFDLKEAKGLLIAEVLKGSAADKSGLKQGDIILKYNGHLINGEGTGTFRNFIALQKPGDKVTLTVIRDKNLQDLTVEVGSEKQEVQEMQPEEASQNPLGFEVQNLPDGSGVVVSQVNPGSLAALIGLEKGTEILAVNQVKVNDKAAFDAQMKANPPDKPYLFLVRQGNSMRYLSLQIK